MAEAGLDDVFADDIIVTAADRYPLGATLFLPRTGKRSRGGRGSRQSRYRLFAARLWRG